MNNLKQLIIRRYVPVVLLLLQTAVTFAQSGLTVKGTVKDSKGETVIGASVVVKGASGVGTVTDFDGNFTLKVPSDKSVLVVS